jgi:hypothetical protein
VFLPKLRECPEPAVRNTSRLAAHPAWRRCSSLSHVQQARSSRLASRARRSTIHAGNCWFGTLAGVKDLVTKKIAVDNPRRFLAFVPPKAWWRMFAAWQ